MNSQDFRNLQEAYLDVYEQEEALDEVLDTFSRKERYANAIGLSGIKAKITGDDETFEKRRKGSQMLQRKMDKESKRKKTMPFGLGRKERKESYDLYDIILSHLIAEGYADTEQAAEAIMVNMSEEWRESIVETRMDPRGRPASGPMNVYANPKGKPSQAHLDAVKSYDAEQKKKTPEQRKAEQDAYRERQMNNK